MQEFQFKDRYCCWICGKAIDIGECNADEYGMAVHEKCYLLKISFVAESKRPIMRKPALDIAYARATAT